MDFQIGRNQQPARIIRLHISGAIQKKDYLALIETNGFKDITVQKEQQIVIPDDILGNYLSAEELATFKQSGMGIYSITVYAEKPAACCDSNCCQ